MNLVVNVCDVMDGGGVIMVEIKNFWLDNVFVWDWVIVLVGDYVSVEVWDNGVGIFEYKL